MRTLFLIFLIFFLSILGCEYLESKRDPYEIGSHWDYSINCENGFIYKVLSDRRGTIQILNSDGTPLRCGEKIH